MIDAEERNDVSPVCPHCKMEINKVFFQQVSAIFGKRYIYFCPHCRAVLGVSHRKGFWMG
jgi:predicted  nucleic acid-binding Zn-ribbon protein